MLSNLKSAWRYPLAVVLGLVTGLYIGGMLATIYVIVAFREKLDTLSPLGLWFIRYPWADWKPAPRHLAGCVDHHGCCNDRPYAGRARRCASRAAQPV